MKIDDWIMRFMLVVCGIAMLSLACFMFVIVWKILTE